MKEKKYNIDDHSKWFDEKMKTAESMIKSMDENDTRNGVATPLQNGTISMIQTILIALMVSTYPNDNTSLFEAIVMLRQLNNKLQNETHES